MVFILWELGTTTLISLTQFCVSIVSEGTTPSIVVILVIIFFSVLTYACWRGTDTPNDIPSPPQPPFFITIRPTNAQGQQNTLQDIHLFSPQPYLSRLIHQINGSTNQIIQSSTASTAPDSVHSQVIASDTPHNSFTHRINIALSQPIQGFIQFVRVIYVSRLQLPILFIGRVFRRQANPNQNIQTSNGQIATSTTSEEAQGRAEEERSEIDNRSIPTTDQSPDADNTSMEAANISDDGLGFSHCDGDLVKFTIKFLNDTQQEVVTSENEKIGDFKRRHFSQELKEKKVVRLIFNGRVIDENLTLKEVGIFEDCVVHCLTVSPTPPPSPPIQTSLPWSSTQVGQSTGSGVNNGRGPEPGFFFVTLLGLILISLWFICFHFGQQLFAPSAVVSLSVLTGIFLIGVVAFYLPVHPATNRP